MKPEDLATVIEYAELAPSILNTQPWSFAASSAAIDVRADRTRGLPVLDPRGRQLALSCGTAVEFARLAICGLGWDCTVHVLPDPGDADLMATLEIGPRRQSTAEERTLVDAILRRHTDRGDYKVATLGPAFVADLEREVSARGAWLRVLDHDGDRLAVIQALSEADAAEATDSAYRQEVDAWLRSERSADGIPTPSLDTQVLGPSLMCPPETSPASAPARGLVITVTHRRWSGICF